MGKKSKAEYATTKFDTGDLFGKSTTNASGTTFTPTNNMVNLANTAWGGTQNALNSLNSGDYSQDANYQKYSNALQNQMKQNYDNALGNLADRGLFRSSGLQAMNNAFNNSLADQTIKLYDSYTNQLNNTLANNQNTLNNLYNYISGLNAGSQTNASNVSNFNLGKQQANANIANQNATLSGGLSLLFSDY